MDSEENSISKVSDVKDIKNTVAKEISYVNSNTSETDNMVDDTTPKMMCTRTYVLGKLPKGSSFDVLNDDGAELVLLAPKFIGFKKLLLVDLHVGNIQNFDLKKFFALNVELSAVPGKTSAFTSSKFSGIIRSSFTLEANLKKARDLTVSEKILVNDEVKKVNSHLNWEVIVKKIPVDLLKSAVITVFSKFGKIVLVRIQLIGLWQKAWMEFKSSNMASMVAAKWLVLIRKNSVRVVLAVGDKQMWVFRDHYRALLYTLPIGTITHNLSELLAFYGGKTCFIGCNPVLYAPGLSLACCAKCDQFDYVFDDCSQASIAHPVSFGSKTWAQVANSSPSCVVSSSLLNAEAVLGVETLYTAFVFFDVSGFNDYLTFLEHSLKLMTDQVSGILKNLNFVDSMLLSSVSHVFFSIAFASPVLDLVSDMALNNVLVLPTSSFLGVGIIFSDFSPSSLKILTTKVYNLESKMVALEVSICLVLARLNSLGFGLGFMSLFSSQ
ncbi:hypothetical protein G9A89_010983 [Geosiphon pyriformis]|nr:hypothetical protein G9A89_010983 [Geosiphon pyriformis]